MSNENFNELQVAARKQGEIIGRYGQIIGQSLIYFGKSIEEKDEQR